jgi:DNA polymerase III alpha subunit (gram-positive type)
MSDESDEVYISVDIEAAGPIPGTYSMLSLGACVVGDYETSFYAELQPLNENCIPEAMAVSKFTLEQLRATGEEPGAVMQNFAHWIEKVRGDRKPVFVGFNATFDWAFINWYFHTFLGENPFGIGGVDIKAFYMGLAGSSWNETRSSQLPAEFRPRSNNVHNALADALSQGRSFASLLAASKERNDTR